MRMNRDYLRFDALIMVLAVLSVTPTFVFAHCDGIDGPVVKAAQNALAKGDVNAVLIWVQPNDERELREVFRKTLAVRKLSTESKDLADRYFFETLVRLHRAGEGAPYTGLKPARRDLGPAIPAADSALDQDSLEPLLRLMDTAVNAGIHEQFKKAAEKRKFPTSDIAAGREYVRAYVEYIHYVERLYSAAKTSPRQHYQENTEEADNHH